MRFEKRREAKRIEVAKQKQDEAIKEAFSLIEGNALDEAKIKLKEAKELSRESGVKPNLIRDGYKIIALIEMGDEAKKIAQTIIREVNDYELNDFKKTKTIPTRFLPSNEVAQKNLASLLSFEVDKEIELRKTLPTELEFNVYKYIEERIWDLPWGKEPEDRLCREAAKKFGLSFKEVKNLEAKIFCYEMEIQERMGYHSYKLGEIVSWDWGKFKSWRDKIGPLT